MLIYMRYIFIFFVISVLTASCAKEEGIGGSASIVGNIFAIDYVNDWSSKPDTLPAGDEDVFIIYGDEKGVSDDVKTKYDGSFAFEYLREGNYTIFVYTNDYNIGEINKPLIYEVSLSDDSTEDLGDIYIYKSDEGTCTIKGKLYVNDYNSEMKPKTPEENYYGADEDVFIRFAGSDTYIDKTATNEKGEYQFSRLPKGEFEVYAFSDNPELDAYGRIQNQQIVRSVSVVLEKEFTEKVLEDIVIVK